MFTIKRPDRDYAAFIFDNDGTLAHSMPLHMEAWNAGLAEGEAPFRLDRDRFMEVAGMALRQTIDHWNAHHRLQLDADLIIQTKNEFFATNRHRVAPLAPTVAYARELRENGKLVAVASGGTREDVEETLRIIDVRTLFDVVVTADDVEHGKPEPDLFLLAAKRLGVDPKECCVVEDSELGIQAAEACGMGWIRIPVLL